MLSYHRLTVHSFTSYVIKFLIRILSQKNLLVIVSDMQGAVVGSKQKNLHLQLKLNTWVLLLKLNLNYHVD